ncbi:MAG: site-specific integrase [Caulobacter sp.]
MKAVSLKLPNAHRVVKRTKSGRVRIYWYRCRGGDAIGKFTGLSMVEALADEAAGAEKLIAAYAAKPIRREASSRDVAGLIFKYKTAPDGFVRLASSTQVNWRRSLDLIGETFGTLPLSALGAKGLKRKLIEWRNGFQATPRQADNHMTVMKRLFSWGVENGEIEINPAEGIRGIYKAKRAELIVEEEDLRRILSKVSPEAGRAIRLAAATGLRRGDLIKLRWSHVETAYGRIRVTTNKSGNAKTVIAPLKGDALAVIEELRAIRAEMPDSKDTDHLLLTAHGKPWAKDSLTQAFGRAAAALSIDRHLHDLRGTAITRLVAEGYSNEHIANMAGGWELSNVANIRKHYVDPATATMQLIALEHAAKTG